MNFHLGNYFRLCLFQEMLWVNSVKYKFSGKKKSKIQLSCNNSKLKDPKLKDFQLIPKNILLLTYGTMYYRKR